MADIQYSSLCNNASCSICFQYMQGFSLITKPGSSRYTQQTFCWRRYLKIESKLSQCKGLCIRDRILCGGQKRWENKMSQRMTSDGWILLKLKNDFVIFKLNFCMHWCVSLFGSNLHRIIQLIRRTWCVKVKNGFGQLWEFVEVQQITIDQVVKK